MRKSHISDFGLYALRTGQRPGVDDIVVHVEDHHETRGCLVYALPPHANLHEFKRWYVNVPTFDRCDHGHTLVPTYREPGHIEYLLTNI